MNLMPFLTLLEDAGLGVKEHSLFLNMMPASAETAVMLRSPLQGTKIDHELPGYFQTEFQMIVRCRRYSVGEELARTAVEALTITVDDTEVEDLLVKYCRPITEPVVFPLSDGNLLEFNVQFAIAFVRVT